MKGISFERVRAHSYYKYFAMYVEKKKIQHLNLKDCLIKAGSHIQSQFSFPLLQFFLYGKLRFFSFLRERLA